jgi:glycosyltransferase involved in cell wall biosynthesis
MRICFISSYPPNRARLSEYAQNLVGEIANRPSVSKVYVFADTVKDFGEEPVGNPKIEVQRVWTADGPLSILGILWQIIKLKPDIVHFNVHFQSYGKTRIANFFGFLLVPLSRIFGFRTMVLLHNIGDKVDLKKVRLKPSLFNKVGILLATKLLLSASSIVVTVKSYSQYLEERYGYTNVQYIPHGTSANNCLNLINNYEKVVLMFGHMGPSKGLSVMFQAIENLAKERGNVKLVIAGNSHPNFPGYLDEIRKTAPPAVDFLGYVSEENIPKVFGAADVIVLPYSTATGTSGVFHLACGYGKPIVASSLPEIKELVSDGASALLVPPGDAKALQGAISAILFNNSLTAKMSEQNLIFAKREQWDAVAEAYEKVYLRLLHFKLLDDSTAHVSVTVPSCEDFQTNQDFQKLSTKN